MTAEDVRHELWLIYEQLKEAEADQDKRLDLLSQSRQELGQVINRMHRQKEPGLYAFLSNAGPKRKQQERTAPRVVVQRTHTFAETVHRGAMTRTTQG